MKWLRRHLVYLAAAVILVLNLTDAVSAHYLVSGSMAPAYPTGSVMIISRLVKPEPGRICAYLHSGNTVIHRIEEETENGYIFKGDANNMADPYIVTKEEIEGGLLIGLPFPFMKEN